MDPIATHVAHYLATHPYPALRVCELLDAVAERVDRTVTPRRIRTSLAEHPARFRLLDPWQGAWHASGGRAGGRAAPTGSRRALPEEEFGRGCPDDTDRDRDGELWVVLLPSPDDPPGPGQEPLVTLRECVRWLARSVDPRSPMSVSRWYALALSERAARRALAERLRNEGPNEVDARCAG